MLVALSESDEKALAPIAADGTIRVDKDVLVRILSRALGSLGVRAAVASVDYAEWPDGRPEATTRSLTGIWWIPRGNDQALTGNFVVDGPAITLETEGEGKSPLVEDPALIGRATKAVSEQHSGSAVEREGLFTTAGNAGPKTVHVFVTRDYRIRRPEDLLDIPQLENLRMGRIGLVIVQLIGGEKALVISQGV